MQPRFPTPNSLQGQSPVGLLDVDKLRISADFKHFVVILFHLMPLLIIKMIIAAM
jgi:hypothetical protein